VKFLDICTGINITFPIPIFLRNEHSLVKLRGLDSPKINYRLRLRQDQERDDGWLINNPASYTKDEHKA
jgi:hypothetical protein